MFDLKKWIAKVSQWIDNHATNPCKYEYVGDVGSNIFNGDWVAPYDGMVVAVAQWNNAHGTGYWYIADYSPWAWAACLSTTYTNNFRLSASFPVIKGHTYYSPNKSAIQTANAYFYKLVGGGST